MVTKNDPSDLLPAFRARAETSFGLRRQLTASNYGPRGGSTVFCGVEALTAKAGLVATGTLVCKVSRLTKA